MRFCFNLFSLRFTFLALVAQWIERWFPEPKAAGSIPAKRTR